MDSARTSIFNGHKVLILGQAGTGKSKFLRDIYADLKREGKTVQALGTTGISSCNLPAGRTVHSFFGLLDGRFTNEQLVSRINDDDNYFATKQRILSNDVVMIDECSMLSRKIIEQIDFLCGKVRNTAVPFGGIQMCFFGDLFQLPPVPNHMYDDNGDSFISAGYKLHVYILKNVYRQTEADFVKAVHELSRGEVSDHTDVLMKSLSRDIKECPSQKAVRLFALNYDVDLYNSKELLKLSGEMVSYSSHDSGDVKKLAKMLSPKTLYLKLDAPVMCNINMNDEIVNGLCGNIVRLEDDDISVYFPSLNKTTVLTRHSFTIFDREKGIDVACRRQFPVRLSFALTVHKAQGLTIPKLVVDCRHMRNPGQIGVATGRATELSNLQVLHFNRALVRRHKNVVYDFYTEPLLPIIDDLTCCKGIIEERKFEESTDSNKSDEEFDELREFEIAENEIRTFVQEQGPRTCAFCRVELVKKFPARGLTFADCLIKNIPKLNGMVNRSQLTSQKGTSGSQLHATKRKSSEKGKAPSKKSKVIPEYPCVICEKECENDCVACDACNQWFHFICLQMSPGDFEEDVDWFCNKCKT